MRYEILDHSPNGYIIERNKKLYQFPLQEIKHSVEQGTPVLTISKTSKENWKPIGDFLDSEEIELLCIEKEDWQIRNEVIQKMDESGDLKYENIFKGYYTLNFSGFGSLWVTGQV